MPGKKFLTVSIWLDEFCRGHRQKSKITNQTRIGQEQKSWFWGTKLGRGHPGTTGSSSHGGPAGLSLSTVARSGLAQRDVGIRAGSSGFGTIGPLWPKGSKVIGSQHPWINFLSVYFHCHKGEHGVWRKGEIFLRQLSNNFVGVCAVTAKSSIFNCSSPLQVEVVDLDISRAWSRSRREQCQQLWRHCLLCLSGSVQAIAEVFLPSSIEFLTQIQGNDIYGRGHHGLPASHGLKVSLKPPLWLLTGAGPHSGCSVLVSRQWLFPHVSQTMAGDTPVRPGTRVLFLAGHSPGPHNPKPSGGKVSPSWQGLQHWIFK